MSNQNQVELLNVLCADCTQNTSTETGCIQCQSKSEDLCVAAVKHLDKKNVLVVKKIDFKGFENFKSEEVIFDTQLGCFKIMKSLDFEDKIKAVCCFGTRYQHGIDETGYFDFTEQGYKSACDFLTNERIKIIKELCNISEIEEE